MPTPFSSLRRRLRVYCSNYSLFVICLSSCLLTCTRDDDGFFHSETLVTVEPATITDFTPDHWVYITDEKGDVLDVKKTIANQPLSLTGPSNIDKFNLTIVSAYYHTDDSTNLSIVTYADVDKGSDFRVKFGTGFQSQNPGEFNVKSLSGYHSAVGLRECCGI